MGNLFTSPSAASLTEVISRNDTVEDTAPTVGEFATPNTSSRAVVWLNGVIMEAWTYASGAWVKADTFKNSSLSFIADEVVTAAATITVQEISDSGNRYGVAASGGPYSVTVEAGAPIGSEVVINNVDAGDITVAFSGAEDFEGDATPTLNGVGTAAFKKTTATNWAAVTINQSA